MTTNNPDKKPMDYYRASALLRNIQAGNMPSDEEFDELKVWLTDEFFPMLEMITQLFIDSLTQFFISLKRIVDSLPEHLKAEIYDRAELQAARDRHPAGKNRVRITTISPLEKQLRLDTQLVPDGPGYMARREAYIQERLDEAGITPNVMPLSIHPAYRPGRGRIKY